MNATGVNDVVRFRYIPLNHVAPNGSFACNESFACPDTRFDTCLARVTCDPLDGRCLPAAQQQLASYLACFEGPFANREVQTNTSRRMPCLTKAFGEDAAAISDRIKQCLANDVADVEVKFNATRAPMYKRLQPNPGMFPHIFLGGEHFWNNSWTALLRAICSSAQTPKPPACAPGQATLTFDADITGGCGIMTPVDSVVFCAAVRDGANLAAARFALPNGWATEGEPGQGDKPSYVDERAVAEASLTKCTTNAGLASQVKVQLELHGVLAALDGTLRGAVEQDGRAPSAEGIAALIKGRLVTARYQVAAVSRVQYT